MLVKENHLILPLRYVVLRLSLVLSVHLLLMFFEISIEHQQDSIKGKWESSGATEHCLK